MTSLITNPEKYHAFSIPKEVNCATVLCGIPGSILENNEEGALIHLPKSYGDPITLISVLKNKTGCEDIRWKEN